MRVNKPVTRDALTCVLFAAALSIEFRRGAWLSFFLILAFAVLWLSADTTEPKKGARPR